MTTLPPGQLRDIQCENAVERVTMEHELAQKACKRSDDEQDKAHKRIWNKIGQMSVIKSQNDVISTEFHLYNEKKRHALQPWVTTQQASSPNCLNDPVFGPVSNEVEVASSVDVDGEELMVNRSITLFFFKWSSIE